MGDAISSLLFQPPPPTRLKESKVIWLTNSYGKRIPSFFIECAKDDRTGQGLRAPLHGDQHHQGGAGTGGGGITAITTKTTIRDITTPAIIAYRRRRKYALPRNSNLLPSLDNLAGGGHPPYYIVTPMPKTWEIYIHGVNF